MSLETVISGLVTATNELTNEVAGKMKGIDKKVLAAVKAIPELGREWHIDAIAGSDEGEGTGGDPLRTIKEAMSRSKNIPFVTLILRENQVHDFQGESDNSPYWEVPGALRIICRQTSGNTKIAPMITTRSGYSSINFLAPVDGGSVFFQDVTLSLPKNLDDVDNPKNNTFARSFIDRAHQGRFVSGGALFARCNLELSSVWPLLDDGYSGNYIVSLFSSSVKDDEDALGQGLFVKVYRSTLTLTVSNTSMDASLGTSIKDIVTGIKYNAAGVPLNVLSNIDFTQE